MLNYIHIILSLPHSYMSFTGTQLFKQKNTVHVEYQREIG